MTRPGSRRGLTSRFALALGPALFCLTAGCGPPGPSDPAVVTVRDDDLGRFWRGVDEALAPDGYSLFAGAPPPSPSAWQDGLEARLARVLQRRYLDSASAPLERFVRERGIMAGDLAGAVRREWDRYARARETASLLTDSAFHARMREVQARLHRWYPEAAFPPVHLVLGTGASGGTAYRGRIVLAVEAAADADGVLQLWAHELAHAQQRSPDAGRVLNRALLEGGADLAAEWLTGIPVRSRSYAWGRVHEARVREAFATDARTDRLDRWFANPGRPDWPPDLGYFAGYRIFRTGLSRGVGGPDTAGSRRTAPDMVSAPDMAPGQGAAPDTAAALQDILRWRNADAVLRDFGWTVGPVARVMEASHRRMGSPGPPSPGGTLVAEAVVTRPDGGTGVARVASRRDGHVRVAQSPGMNRAGLRDVRPAGPHDTATVNWLRGHELHALVLFPETRLYDPVLLGAESEGVRDDPGTAGSRGDPGTLAVRWMLNARDSLVIHYSLQDTLPVAMEMSWVEPPVTVSLEDWVAGSGMDAPGPWFRRAVFRQGEEDFTWRYTRVEWAPPGQDPPR